MAKENKLPTNEEIDVLAQLYVDAQNAVELARDRESKLWDQLTEMVEKHGSVPRRATKSKRIEGDEYQVTLSKGHSVEVDTPRAEIFRKWMKSNNLSRVFRKLFRRETVFVLQPDAQALVNTIAQGAALDAPVAANLCAIFHHSLTIKDNSPYLKVELKKKDEKSKEAAA